MVLNTSQNRQSILIIDDSVDILNVQRLLLEKSGFDVLTAESGSEALTLLNTIAQPSLILLDMQMDDMTGLEFLETLEEKNPNIIDRVPVVFLSGTDAAPKSKAIGFIRKPFDMHDYVDKVQRFIELGAG